MGTRNCDKFSFELSRRIAVKQQGIDEACQELTGYLLLNKYLAYHRPRLSMREAARFLDVYLAFMALSLIGKTSGEKREVCDNLLNLDSEYLHIAIVDQDFVSPTQLKGTRFTGHDQVLDDVMPLPAVCDALSAWILREDVVLTSDEDRTTTVL